MGNIAIKAENISKAYQLGEFSTGTLSRDIERWWALTRGKEDPFLQLGEANDRSVKGERDIVWSLKDINFEINQGDAVGIIGKNGAGKSTLLKILSRVTTPTTGLIKVNGRIASLLEVGTGFHPELTGRENIYLNGAILGMRKKEVSRKFDEIVDFSGIERYVDTPVKRYSSGMYVRLAFAVAAHLESEILVVDEVLAVGDAEFQKKCLGKMGDVSKKEGRTVLFVSHNMQAISTITSSSLLLANGKNVFFGPTHETISEYLKNMVNKDLTYSSAPSAEKANITSVSLITSEVNNNHINGERMEIHLSVNCPAPIRNAGIGCQIVNDYDQAILHTWLFNSAEIEVFNRDGVFKLICVIPKFRLYMGKYSLNIYLSANFGREILDKVESICHFEVSMYNQDREYPWEPNSCTYIEDFSWKVI